eukprot:Gb_12401 [translate_table: standard]
MKGTNKNAVGRGKIESLQEMWSPCCLAEFCQQLLERKSYGWKILLFYKTTLRGNQVARNHVSLPTSAGRPPRRKLLKDKSKYFNFQLDRYVTRGEDVEGVEACLVWESFVLKNILPIPLLLAPDDPSALGGGGKPELATWPNSTGYALWFFCPDVPEALLEFDPPWLMFVGAVPVLESLALKAKLPDDYEVSLPCSLESSLCVQVTVSGYTRKPASPGSSLRYSQHLYSAFKHSCTGFVKCQSFPKAGEENKNCVAYLVPVLSTLLSLPFLPIGPIAPALAVNQGEWASNLALFAAQQIQKSTYQLQEEEHPLKVDLGRGFSSLVAPLTNDIAWRRKPVVSSNFEVHLPKWRLQCANEFSKSLGPFPLSACFGCSPDSSGGL